MLLFANVDLNSVAPLGSAVYVIDKLVDELDTSEMEREYDLESEKGNEPFHPKTLIKVALYAMHNVRFSLRKMEHDTGFNLGYRWLTGDKGIDHSTMGKFLVKHKERIIELFTQVVALGVEKELIDFEVIAADTVKIRANASYKQFRTREGIRKEREKIKLKITELIENVGNENEAEVEILKKREERLQEALEVLQERIKGKSEGEGPKGKEKVEKKEKINITDFDCLPVEQANGEKNPGYCVTTATDTKHDVITFFELNENNDVQVLPVVLEGSEENTGRAHEIAVADAGFGSVANLEKLEEKGQKALIPDRRYDVEERESTAKGEYDRSKFIYNERSNEYRCPLGKKLGNAGSFQANGRTYDRYANPGACQRCARREVCTKGKYRIINRDRNEAIKERMRKELRKKANRKIYAKRAHSAESPFGQIKHNLRYRIFMRRGNEKIKMECSLLFMLHNILKIGQRLYAE
jgi:transposase